MAITSAHGATDAIRSVTGTSFEQQVLSAPGPIAVEFMSYGCVHCRLIEPVLQQVAHELRATETVFRLNIAVEQELADRYAVESTPTFVMFQDGSEVGRVAGPKPTVASVRAALTRCFES